MTETTGNSVPMISASHVTAGYGLTKRGPAVLHDVSLAVGSGKILGIVGESGSGKSTLAKVLVGQLIPSTGEVLVDGVDVSRLSRKGRRLSQRNVQLIPQDPYASLDPRMTIGETLLEALSPNGGRMSQYTDRIGALLETVTLDASAARSRSSRS
jgi:ABC-type dipeptide/oligopeptide/nickel transport system ATPase subunit